MQVLLLGPWPPPHGGVQTHLVALRHRLTELDIPTAVINLTSAPESGDPGVHYPRSAAELVLLLARLPYDIVHLHLGGHLSARLLGLAGVCAVGTRARSVLTFHSGGYPASPAGKSAGRRTLRGMVLRRFDRIIAVNAELVGLFQRLGCKPERVRFIPPHGVPAQGSPGGPLPASLEAFFQSHRPVLVSVGLLEPEYDLELQLDTLPKLRERMPGAGLAIIGSGSLAEALRRRIAASPVREHILLAGDVAHESTLGAISRADALLRTTRYDGDSISVREALALGTPVIASDTGLRPAGVQLFPIGSPAGLTEAVTRALANGRAAVPAFEGTPANLDAVVALYRELAR